MVCGGDKEVEMASNPSKQFCCGEEQKNGVFAGWRCGVKDTWFWFYCSENKRYCIVFLQEWSSKEEVIEDAEKIIKAKLLNKQKGMGSNAQR